ncbi:hypothetical protein ACNKHU_18620 [Shigella flexneri]
MLMESDDQKLLMASDGGLRFLSDLQPSGGAYRAGKASITLPENAQVTPRW